MNMRQKLYLVLALIVIAAGTLIGSGLLADLIDDYSNEVYKTELPTVSKEAQELHRSLFIVDLHADTMLWNRDLLKRSARGHVDLPRLKEANVALQVFAAVTDTPNKHKAPAKSQLTEKESKCLSGKSINMTGLLQVAQLRPLGTWFNLKNRALYQANRLRDFAVASNGDLQLIESVDDLRNLVQARLRGASIPVGALIALEGAHWLGTGSDTAEDVTNGVKELFDAGFRMLAPTHRFNNALGAASEGCNQKVGFTDNGRAFLQAVGDSNIILDLAHASDPGVSEAAKASAAPVVISHTGLREHCRHPTSDNKTLCDIARNMRDEEVRDVARTGGVVGIGIWVEAVGHSMQDVVDSFVAAHDALNESTFVEEMHAKNPDMILSTR